MDRYTAIYITENEKIVNGYICSFCNRIFEKLDSINQVVVAPSSESINSYKMKWMCDICSDQGRYVTFDGFIVLSESTKITQEQVHKEWGNRIYSRYRKEVLGNN